MGRAYMLALLAVARFPGSEAYFFPDCDRCCQIDPHSELSANSGLLNSPFFADKHRCVSNADTLHQSQRDTCTTWFAEGRPIPGMQNPSADFGLMGRPTLMSSVLNGLSMDPFQLGVGGVDAPGLAEPLLYESGACHKGCIQQNGLCFDNRFPPIKIKAPQANLVTGSAASVLKNPREAARQAQREKKVMEKFLRQQQAQYLKALAKASRLKRKVKKKKKLVKKKAGSEAGGEAAKKAAAAFRFRATHSGLTHARKHLPHSSGRSEGEEAAMVAKFRPRLLSTASANPVGQLQQGEVEWV